MTIDEPLGNERPMNTALAAAPQPMAPQMVLTKDLMAFESLLVEELDRLGKLLAGPMRRPLWAARLLGEGAKLTYALRGAARLLAAGAPDGVVLPTTRTESAIPGRGFGYAVPEADAPKLLGNCWLCRCSIHDGDPYQRDVTGSFVCQNCHQ
jgi:hypothetical protein